MSEINVTNFECRFAEIEKSLEEAKFIGIDLEFSALYPLKNQTPSLFDSASGRYIKLKKNLRQVIPLQIGLTAFKFDPKINSYYGTIYNFYIAPATFPTMDKSFYFQASTLSFLRFYGFNFDKFGTFGIPFMNRVQEEELRAKLNKNDICDAQSSFNLELELIYDTQCDTINKWFINAKRDDIFTVADISAFIISRNYEILYFLHKNFRRKFKNLWTFVENDQFKLKKVSSNEYCQLEKSNNLDEELLSNLLGFTKIFRVLTALHKPIVGHNLFQDILLMIESFECSLPYSYQAFKQLAHELFPVIFDTRTISYEILKQIPEHKRLRDRGLGSIFKYFKDGVGRHLVLHSPAIEIVNETEFGKFHEAGWDSYCAGYIFIRMAYLNIYQKYPKSKTFMSSELIGGLDELKNSVNVIRGSISSIKLDGNDPVSTRPPYLVIESLKKTPVDIYKVSAILSSFGFVEVKKLPYQNRKALIAVDNFGSARRILNNFQKSSEFRIKQYSMLRHSPIVRTLLLSGITISGCLVIWFSHSIFKR